MPEVVQFASVSNDISRALRAAADRVDAGEYPGLRFVVAVFVDSDAAFTSYVWGQASTLEAIGALARAMTKDLADC
jgi:hypothetical protein